MELPVDDRPDEVLESLNNMSRDRPRQGSFPTSYETRQTVALESIAESLARIADLSNPRIDTPAEDTKHPLTPRA